MSGRTTAQAFVERFLLPVLQGREFLLGTPLGSAEFEELVRELQTTPEIFEPVELHLQRRAREMLHPAPLIDFDSAALRLSIALHQALFAAHASAARGRVSRARLAALAGDLDRLITQIPAPRTAAHLVKHHLLVEPLLRMFRADTKVFFTAGSKSFFGEPVRWLRLPFRWQVQVEQTVGTDVLVHLAQGPMGAPTMALLARSPLTLLLRPDRLLKSLSFEGLDLVFVEQSLCRYVTHELIDRGLIAAMPGLAHAFSSLAGKVSENGKGPQKASLQRTLVLSAQFLLALALTNEFWLGNGRQQHLEVRYEPPSRTLSFEPPAVTPEEAQRGETDGAQRVLLAKDGWAIIACLLSRVDRIVDRIEFPAADRNLAALRRLNLRIASLSGQLGESMTRMESLFSRVLPTCRLPFAPIDQ